MPSRDDINIVVALILTPVLSRLPRGIDETVEADYHAELGDPGVHSLSIEEPGVPLL